MKEPPFLILGLGVALLTLLALGWVLRAGRPRPGAARYAPGFSIIVIVLCAASTAAALEGWRELQSGRVEDPTGTIVVACGALFFLWGAGQALTQRLEWNETGFTLSRFLRPPIRAAWSEIAATGFARRAFWVDLKGDRPRRVAVSRFLVGLQAFADEAARHGPIQT